MTHGRHPSSHRGQYNVKPNQTSLSISSGATRRNIGGILPRPSPEMDGILPRSISYNAHCERNPTSSQQRPRVASFLIPYQIKSQIPKPKPNQTNQSPKTQNHINGTQRVLPLRTKAVKPLPRLSSV